MRFEQHFGYDTLRIIDVTEPILYIFIPVCYFRSMKGQMGMKAKRALSIGIGFTARILQVMDADDRASTFKTSSENNMAVGFAKFNTWFHQITGVHMPLYTVTDWLGLVPIAVCMGFGVLGLVQLIRRRSLFR